MAVLPHNRRSFLMAWATVLAFAFCLVAAAAPAPLDVSGCERQDGECVTLLKNIETIKLQHELEKLSVETERVRLADFIEAKVHRNNAFQTQYIASWIILVLVIAIVGVGLLMSWLQLIHGLKKGTVNNAHMELGAGGIKMQSSVIGLVIFIASIAFFSIYIEKVYTITVIEAHSDAKPAPSPQASKP